jgi:hypothetical protein
MADEAMYRSKAQNEITKSFRWLVFVLAACCVCLLLILFGVTAAFHQRDKARQNEHEAQMRLEKLQTEQIERAAGESAMNARVAEFRARVSMLALADNLCNEQHKFESARDVLTYMLEHEQITPEQASHFFELCRPKGLANKTRPR